LEEAGIASVVCADLAEFQSALNDHASFAVVTEEALKSADLHSVASFLQAQPAWSDLPFIILTFRGGGLERNPDALRLSELLGTSRSEGPFHPTTLSVSRAQR
jgi:hypothetical protein